MNKRMNLERDHESVVLMLCCSFAFDTKCVFGRAGCSSATAVLGWANNVFNILGCIAFVGLMRYSEGANFAVIVLVGKRLAMTTKVAK